MFYGKLIGGVLGLLVLGPLGLLIGLFVGHLFDKGLWQTLRFASPENIARIKQSFFESTFLLSGYMAKADGHISQQEIDHTEMVISQMGLSAEQRKRAIELFREGSAANFQPEPAISRFLEATGGQQQLKQTLLFFQISLAMADQALDDAERDALNRIATLLGFTRAQLEQMLRMAQAQGHFHGHGGAAGPEPGTTLEDAYEALGVSKDVDDKSLKRAYRKLMSENHPDKLIAQGVPEDMVKMATEKSQDIQAAYEMIKKSRGMK
ncbi:molecular chaperone DjlA [Halioglobus sp. HI00S01]|uniref:co-chaperone DjlA n=1 Tax=Halioglobus sp. HI00S01 TaxID=1822214 RepID=UPI0007C3F9A2|nr:co-chaperone DjlA [Halioglobus sp. HI00S01]KZX58128.1 molecular chaperone DjlA [Halioglobus sp. HI00S01]